MTAVHPVLAGSPYQAYVYAYPHKTAYRPFAPRPLSDVWAGESQSALSLYIHIPFCGMRCGFCNLFTTPRPQDAFVAVFMDALKRQAEITREHVPDAKFAHFAVGGGTPTYLDECQLDAMFDIAERVMGVEIATTPTGVEVSPDTVTPGKLAVLKARGTDRVSIGIQSFFPAETAGCGRPQSREQVETALAAIRDAGFDALNIDLIYGLDGQDETSWLASLRAAVAYRPEELYLYPLYVRPLTGLGRSRRAWDDVRLGLYRAGRDYLLGDGYEQVSMRVFRRPRPGASAVPEYCDRDDGMIGLGCGARSYTAGLHYSLEYAVSHRGVKEILAGYVARSDAEFAAADYGFALDADERRRRFVLQSILNRDGLDEAHYRARFATNPLDDLPELRELIDADLLIYSAGRIVPTDLGVERSDALGPWLFSPGVRHLMAGYELR